MPKTAPARPVTLPLLKLRLPLAGWVSLMHRVSGVFLFLALPVALYVLQQSLLGPAEFARVQEQLMQPAARVVILLLVWALAHHLFAGVRHLLMDLHIGVGLASARRSGLLVILADGAVVISTAWRLFA